MASESSGIFRRLYGLVKAFLKDFYTESKRGTLQHKKGIAIFLGFVLICAVVIVIGLYKVSESPFFCGICHNMKVYVDSWKSSSHRQVDCIDCHYKPGLVNHLKGKWQDGQLSMVYFVTGKSPTRPHAEIDDASCLQCHKRADLKDRMVFKNVLFSHPSHIERMKRQKQLRCTTCHSQIVQGAHMTVTDVECFICHFYKTKDQKEYVTGCPTCHFEARGDIKVSEQFTFNHKRYIARGIDCERCHTTVVSGDGHIPEFACLQCHNKREILEAKYTPEFLHENHVTKHKVECFTCHSPIKHEISGLHYKGQVSAPCADCHPGGLHMPQASMYLGKGAKFVDDRPNRMAAINMDCSVCHGQSKETPAQTCESCHGGLTSGMLERWKKNLKEGQEELSKAIAAAKSAGGGRASGQTLRDAQFNYDFVKNGGGIHNIVYAMGIIEATKKALQDGSPKTRGSVAKAGQVSCTVMCHGDIGEKSVPFGSVKFPHAMHVEGEASCLKCHSKYPEHGKTYMLGCSECHHGEGMGKVKCSDCHSREAAMYNGKGVKGIGAQPDPMYGKVACTECHVAVKRGKKEGIRSVKASCVTCHDKDYAAVADEWAAQSKKLQEKYSASLSALEQSIAAIEKKEGRHSVPLRARLDEISDDTRFLTEGKVQHNPQYAEAIAAKIDKNTTALQTAITLVREGRRQRIR